ncbi:hypothetical protein [Paenibacillus koleovorans]|uniref:hypothetical protein n=1 Tax=Paenibacillus koleovorans TaxID=121608 RepID=UPI000FD7092F|nr:hypothetical protein [Paenibacillus koleovorans]
MDPIRLRALRRKQILFLNGIVSLILPGVGGFFLLLQPSPHDVYGLGILVYAALVVAEIWGIFFPKHLWLLYGPRFMREIAEYERERIGKKQDLKAKIIRIVAFTVLLGNQYVAFSRIRNDEPMRIENLVEFWSILAIVVLIFLLAVNVAVFVRIHKIDQPEGDFRWFTTKMLAWGIGMGVVAVFLMSVGFGLVLN